MTTTSGTSSAGRGTRRRVTIGALATLVIVGLVGVVLVAMGSGTTPRQGTYTSVRQCPEVVAGAQLQGQDLSACDLTDKVLTDINLTDATLTGATLTDAILTGATLTGVKSGQITGWPRAFPPDWSMIAGRGTLTELSAVGYYLVGPGANLRDAVLVGWRIGGNPDATTPCETKERPRRPGFDISGTIFTGATNEGAIFGVCIPTGGAMPTTSQGAITRNSQSSVGLVAAGWDFLNGTNRQLCTHFGGNFRAGFIGPSEVGPEQPRANPANCS